MITNNLSTLKINKLTQAQYDKALSEGRINDNELYLTPDSGTIDIDISELDSKYLHNFTINLSHQTGGNPRESKFLTVDYSAYTSNYATYIKLSAASCHGNGSSYQFLEDILIGVSTEGNSITCKVIKYCQSSVNSSSSYGDVFYVLDSTNKKVYFYILGGQWANTLFTPFTVIGSATGTGVTQHSGAAEYYSTGDKVMAQGNNTLLFNCVDTISDQTISGDKIFTGSTSFSGPVGNTQSTAGVYLGLDENSVPNANIAIASANTAAYIDMGTPNKDYGFRIIKWNNSNGKYDAEFCYGDDGSGGASATINVPRKSGTMALTSDIPNNYVDTSSDQNIGGNKTFTSGVKIKGTGTVLNNEGTAVTENVETTVNPTGIKLESYSTTNYYDFPTNSGTLAVVSYDKSSHTLTIKA